ncbi:transglutaminase TgpA family protein [Polycyclovorans algicola]|uniref:transglutaminase TgpA family protein n=1 Tax=Polycyclovorans algicola TaxID=616992 RepID=UPI0005BCA1BD|nr:DUF3488 and transglutaminase-like domain-containing protein [Polycyclovorans algicola]
MTLTPADVLPRATLLRLMGLLVLVLAPHVLRVPPWETALVVAALAWRLLHLQRGLPLPGKVLKALLTVAAFAGVFVAYGRINGQHPGTALLVLMAALKLLEMRSLRDVRVMVALLYFLVFTHFLFSQEIWTVLWLLGTVVGITGLLVEVNTRAATADTETDPWRQHWRAGAVIVAQALPLMVVFFVLFPRIPGPLWGLPADAGSSRSGVPDSMSPGDIAELILSDELAFRVRFDEAAPAQRQLYWRGPVFERYDGRRWDAYERGGDRNPPALTLTGEPVTLEMMLESTRGFSLFGLEMSDPDALPTGSRLDRDGQLLATRRITERRLLRQQAYPDYQLDADGLAGWQRNRNLQLPRGSAPETRALMRRWRAEAGDDAALINRALVYFREQPFRYTLRPPRLGSQPVDEFLFDTRAGFCEHYASSFVVMMRAAGIPARVVIGYQGGARSRVGEDWVIRQSDAHAWAEVWLDDQGWRRVDPTAAVSPDRIEQGLRGAFDDASGELPDFLRRNGDSVWAISRAQWDFLNAQWNRWFLAYGPELQQAFLSRLGVQGWTQMLLWLTGLVTALLTAVGAWLLWRSRPAPPPDVASRSWRRLQRAARRDVDAPAGETVGDWCQRLAKRQPQVQPALFAARDAYQALRYGPDALQAEAQQQQLDQSIRQVIKSLRRRRSPPARDKIRP